MPPTIPCRRLALPSLKIMTPVSTAGGSIPNRPPEPRLPILIFTSICPRRCTMEKAGTGGGIEVLAELGWDGTGCIEEDPLYFTVAPYLVSITPGSAEVGDPVVISGLNFGELQGASTISFNGVEGTASSWSDTASATCRQGR